jgi:hypothetical protein
MEQSVHTANAELVESLHEFITIWRLIGKPFPQVDPTDRPGLAISWPNTRFPFYNSLFLIEQLTDARVLQDRVQEAAVYMRARPHGGLFVACLDNLSGSAKENLASILAGAKFLQAIPMTGMAGDILPMEALGHAALRFVRISDDSTIKAFAELNCVSYGVPMETGLSLVKEHTLWREHAYGFVAYEGDKPVSTATAIINEDCLFCSWWQRPRCPAQRLWGSRGAYVHGVSDRAGLWRASRFRRTRWGLPLSPTASASRSDFLTRLNTRPARSPVNASTPPLRAAPHDSGPMWVATSHSYDFCIHYTSPFNRRTGEVQ